MNKQKWNPSCEPHNTQKEPLELEVTTHVISEASTFHTLDIQGGSMKLFALRVPFLISLILLCCGSSDLPPASRTQVSTETQTCIDCHEQYTPGIVADWRTSRHAASTPTEAMGRPLLMRRISATSVPAQLQPIAVGCYECHSLNAAAHSDNFEHFGFQINVVVSPGDCRTCHPTEVEQYSAGKKPHALENLEGNPVFHALVETILASKSVKGEHLLTGSAHLNSRKETCFSCHGTNVEVKGTRTINSDAGDLDVPNLSNWPNMGVGRINPDGSFGACTACHARHAFSIEVARKPSTCGQCHVEPDVPAYNVYKESKHGNIYESLERSWTWEAVPWTVGKDFTAPTCAACHNSLLVSPAGTTLAQRSHEFGARVWVRIFGLVYSHPQPKSGSTYTIKNADGLSLPTAFAGTPASSFLIDVPEQATRKDAMQKVCSGCHGSSWIQGHFAKLDSSIAEVDAMVLASTRLLAGAWNKKLADRTNPFDEAIEQLWIRQWLFYANSVRYGSAMGGPDYAAFKNGWWELTSNLQKMHETIPVGRKR
jgi:hydroxylamine dehydrogenase